MSKRATGTFDVKMTPKDLGAGTPVGGMTIDKEFHGDLVGTSKGEMLMAIKQCGCNDEGQRLPSASRSIRTAASSYLGNLW